MSELRECCILRALWRVHQKFILCKVFEFSSVQMFFDVLNNKFDIAVKFFLNLGYTHILKRQKKAVILRIYFEHRLFHRLSHSWQVITCTNRIWPDLISPWRIDNGKLYRATLTPWGWCWPGAGGMPGYYNLSDSLGSSCVLLKWRPSGLVKIGKIEGILTSEQTPLWYRWK